MRIRLIRPDFGSTSTAIRQSRVRVVPLSARVPDHIASTTSPSAPGTRLRTCIWRSGYDSRSCRI